MLSAGEGLDDEHRGAAMPTDEGRSVATALDAAVPELSRRSGWRVMQEFANGGDIVLAVCVGKKTVVPDPMKAGRQDMQ